MRGIVEQIEGRRVSSLAPKEQQTIDPSFAPRNMVTDFVTRPLTSGLINSGGIQIKERYITDELAAMNLTKFGWDIVPQFGASIVADLTRDALLGLLPLTIVEKIIGNLDQPLWTATLHTLAIAITSNKMKNGAPMTAKVLKLFVNFVMSFISEYVAVTVV